MADFDNSNSGAIFKNKDKDAAHPNWADYNGNGQITCTSCGVVNEFWLNVWLKKAKKTGQNFMSIAFNHKDESKAPAPNPPQQSQTPPPADDFDDDIPF